MEPKSGKLHKLGYGLFGPRWTEKWVHLDGRVLKYFSMATDAPVFTLSSSRQSAAIELQDYAFARADDRKVGRKFAFQFVAKAKARCCSVSMDMMHLAYSLKTIVFACSSERELEEWTLAFETRAQSPRARVPSATPIVAEKQQRSANAFTATQNNQRAVSISSDTVSADSAHLAAGVTTLQPTDAVASRTFGKTDSVAKAHVSRPETDSADASDAVAATDWSIEYDALLRQQRNCLDSSSDANDHHATACTIATADFLRRFHEASEQLVCDVVDALALPTDARRVRELPLDAKDKNAVACIEHDAPSSLRKFWANGLLVYVVDANGTATATATTTSLPTETARRSALQELVAHKCIGHELRAARALHDVAVGRGRAATTEPLLRVRLESVVDYLGFRCIVFASSTSTLPDSMPTASSSAAAVELVHDELVDAFSTLGLVTESLDASSTSERSGRDTTRPSFVPARARMVSAEDASSRRVNPSTYELLGLYDTFPADLSTAAAAAGSGQPQPLQLQRVAFACCKFRPEFVCASGAMLPLHANAHVDALSPTSSDQSCSLRRTRRERIEAQLLQHAALSASEFLQCDVVPAFAQALDTAAVDAIASGPFTAALHRAGVNVRYLGVCFSLATAQHTQRLLLCEMVARVCKIELRAALRDVVHGAAAALAVQLTGLKGVATDSDIDDKFGDNVEPSKPRANSDDLQDCNDADPASPAASPLDSETLRLFARALVHSHARAVIVEFFNLVLGLGTAAVESRTFWRDRILPHVRLKFGLDTDTLPTLDALLRDDVVHAPQLFHALQAHTGVAFDVCESVSIRSAQPLTLDDLAPDLNATALTRVLTHSPDGSDVVASVDALAASGEVEQALAQLKLHIAVLDVAPRTERLLALPQLLARAADLSLRLNRLTDAAAFADLAVASSPPTHAAAATAHTAAMHVQAALGDLSAVRAHYTKAVAAAQSHVGVSPHPFVLETHMAMVAILSRSSDDSSVYDDALEIVVRCVEIARMCFGRTSLQFADVRATHGRVLSSRVAHADEAVGVLEDAASVYERFGHDETIDASVAMASKQHAAACYYLIAAIGSSASGASGATRSNVEKAYATARRALVLRTEVLSPSHEDVVSSLLQLGALAQALGDSFRALEYLKPALAELKQRPSSSDTDDSAAQIQSVTQTVLRLQLASLTDERASVVERTRKRFATLLTALATDTTVLSQAASGAADCTSVETQLLAHAVATLFRDDASAYVETLIDRTRDELRGASRQQFEIDVAGTRRQSSAEAPSLGYKQQLPSPATLGARVASFAGVSSPSHRPHQLAPSQSPVYHHPVLPSPRSPCVTSEEQRSFAHFESSSVIVQPSGEFTFGAQLAAVLFLVE